MKDGEKGRRQRHISWVMNIDTEIYWTNTQQNHTVSRYYYSIHELKQCHRTNPLMPSYNEYIQTLYDKTFEVRNMTIYLPNKSQDALTVK